MQSAILLWQIRLSVCLPVTLWYCVETNVYVVKLFPSSGRGMTLVFRPLPPLQNSKGVEYKGWGKFRFSTEIAVYLENGATWAHGYYGSII